MKAAAIAVTVSARGPYAGQPAEVDHIVPLVLAPELDHELANLESLPETLNRRKSDKVGEKQLATPNASKRMACFSRAPLSGCRGHSGRQALPTWK